jgi:hypothetical protein
MSSVASLPGRAAFLLIMTGLLCVLAASRAAAQTPPPSWAGWARCQVDVQGPGYVERRVHTWTSNSGTPTVEGAFRVYPGTWSVVGGGSLQRTQGTQTLVAQWAINGTMTNAPLAVFVRASDGRMLLQARHAQLRAPGAVAGYQQQTIDGKPQTPGRLSGEGFEFAFPLIDAPATDKSVSGRGSPQVNGSVGFMQPAGSRGTAACTWTFGQGTAAPAPPPALAAVPVPSPPAAGAGQAPVALPPGVPR